jgi:hypothetical protein
MYVSTMKPVACMCLLNIRNSVHDEAELSLLNIRNSVHDEAELSLCHTVGTKCESPRYSPLIWNRTKQWQIVRRRKVYQRGTDKQILDVDANL